MREMDIRVKGGYALINQNGLRQQKNNSKKTFLFGGAEENASASLLARLRNA